MAKDQKKPAWVARQEVEKYGQELVRSEYSDEHRISHPRNKGAASAPRPKAGAYQPVGPGSDKVARQQNMSSADQAALKAAGDAYNRAASDEERAKAHAQAERIRNKYGYGGGEDGSGYIPVEPQTVGPQQPVPSVHGEGLDQLTRQLEAQRKAAEEQQRREAEEAVRRGVAELEQAQADAQVRFDTQLAANDREERLALDNQALYAEARGDRGGIGQAQYGQIQAQAMANRQAISSARTKLASDTTRQIAELRAQGQFKQADALLKLTQDYLGRLTDLQKWYMKYSLDRDELQVRMDRWNQELELKIGQLTGSYGDRPTLATRQQEQKRLADMGMAALKSGVRPSPAQQQAMGYTDQQIDAFLKQRREEHRGHGGSGGSRPAEKGQETKQSVEVPLHLRSLDPYQQLFVLGCRDGGDVYRFLTQSRGMKSTQAKDYARYFDQKMSSGALELWFRDYPMKPLDWPVRNLTGGRGYGSWVEIEGLEPPRVKVVEELDRLVRDGTVNKVKRTDGTTEYVKNWYKQ